MTTFQIQTIGVIHSPFKEKFGVPRQPELVPAARAKLMMAQGFDQAEAFRGLEGFSHLWLTFVFHLNADSRWRPTVRPPRLGGNQRLGVFATRSSFRPNPLGLSLVRFCGLENVDGKIILNLGACDLVDGTPILDIKPYLPYADSLPAAKAGFAPAKPGPKLAVEFLADAQAQLRQYRAQYPDLEELITQVLACDPRPAYMEDDPNRQFGVRLEGLNIRFVVNDGVAQVIAIDPFVEPL